MKFFMQAVGNNEFDNELSNEFVDCCLGSPTIDFLKTSFKSIKRENITSNSNTFCMVKMKE